MLKLKVWKPYKCNTIVGYQYNLLSEILPLKDLGPKAENTTLLEGTTCYSDSPGKRTLT